MNLHVIPNSLIAALGLAFYGYAFVSGMPMDDVIWHSQVCAAALIGGFAVCLMVPGLGAGAAKLVAIGFLWFGLEGGATFVAVSMGMLGVYGTVAQRMTGRANFPYLPFAMLTLVLMSSVAIYESSVPISEAATLEQPSE